MKEKRNARGKERLDKSDRRMKMRGVTRENRKDVAGD